MVDIYVGMRVRINENHKWLKGEYAHVAYIGSKGISVYLENSILDECIPLYNNEWDRVEK